MLLYFVSIITIICAELYIVQLHVVHVYIILLGFLSSAIRDIRVRDFTIPDAFEAPGSIDTRQVLEVEVGSASLALGGGDFISALFLSKDKIYDPEVDIKILEMGNSIGIKH